MREISQNLQLQIRLSHFRTVVRSQCSRLYLLRLQCQRLSMIFRRVCMTRQCRLCSLVRRRFLTLFLRVRMRCSIRRWFHLLPHGHHFRHRHLYHLQYIIQRRFLPTHLAVLLSPQIRQHLLSHILLLKLNLQL